MSCDLRSPGSQGSDVHSTDTPRTRELKELRQKRLAYFDTSSTSSEKKSVSSPRPPSHPKVKSGTDSPKSHVNRRKPDNTPSASSPRPRRSVYRPRSSSANSDERSPRSQHSSLERVHPRESRLIDLRLDITPRSRLGSSSSQDLRLDTPTMQNGSHRSNPLRDSFGSLFSDIGSDFTDVTNTDILLSERYAEESLSAIKRKKDSVRSRNGNSNSKDAGLRENKKLSPKETTNKYSPKQNGQSVSKCNRISEASREVCKNGQSFSRYSGENESNEQAVKDNQPFGKSNGMTENNQEVYKNGVTPLISEGLSLTMSKNGEKSGVMDNSLMGSMNGFHGDKEIGGRTVLEGLCIQNVALDSPSQSSVSAQNTSGHTSLWMESDKSTGERTLSQDNVLDDLLPPVSSGQCVEQSGVDIILDDLLPPLNVERNTHSTSQSVDYISNSLPTNVTKDPSSQPTLEGKPPLNAMSQQFVTTSNGFSDTKDLKQSKYDKSSSLSAENLNLSNLSAVLGEERLRRLLLNFKESEDYSDIQSEVTSVSKINKNTDTGDYSRQDGQQLDRVNIWASLDMSETENGYLDSKKVEEGANGSRHEFSGMNVKGTGTMDLSDKWMNGAQKGRNYRTGSNVQREVAGREQGFQSNVSYSRQEETEKELHEGKNPLVESSTGFTFPKLENLEDERSVVEELGLQTHRPEEGQGHMVPVYASHDRKWAVNHMDSPGDAVDVSKGPCTVKYSFSVEQIYARANSVSYAGDQSMEGSPNAVSRLNVTLKQGQTGKEENGKDMDQNGGQLKSDLMVYSEELNLQKGRLPQDLNSRPPKGPLTKSYQGNGALRNSTERKMAWSMDDLTSSPTEEEKVESGCIGVEQGQGDAGLMSQGKAPGSAHISSSPAHFPSGAANSSSDPTHIAPNPAFSTSDPTLSKPIPASIERYFQSIEQASHVSSVGSDTFEPVPEPSIEVTPRGPLQVQGKELHLSEPSTSQVKESKKSPRSPTVKKPPQLPPSSPSKRPGSSSQNVSLDSVSDDQLYHLVQSAISEIDTARSGAITSKLQQLGINFDFLRESYESHRASISEQKTLENEGEGSQRKEEDINTDGTHVTCTSCHTVLPATTLYCTACGSVLSSNNKLTTAPVQSTHSPRISNQQQPQSINNNRLSKESSKSSRVSESLRSQLSLNLRSSVNSADSGTTISATGGLNRARQKRTMRLREKGGGGDAESSISLDYSEKFDNPRESIPQLLKAELSIDLRGSSDSSVVVSSKGKGKTRQSVVQDIRVCDDSETNSVQNETVTVATVDQEVGQGEPTVETEDGGDVLKSSAVIDSSYHEFLQRLIRDPRLRKRPVPTHSQGKPASSATRRSHLAGVQSKVRSSWDKEVPARRWEKSNLAWSSYNPRELSKQPATRHSSANRPSSAGKSRETAGTSPRQQRKQRPQSADISGRRSLPHHDCGSQQEAHHFEPQNSHRGTGPLLSVQSAVSSKGKERPGLRESKNTRLNNYKKYLALAQGYTGKLYEEDEASELDGRRTRVTSYTEALMMSPRVHSGEVSFMQCLPDEIVLHIFSYLKHRDLARCLSVCQHFHRVASDDSLWRNITIRKCQNMTDQSLSEIGKRRPQSLSLIQCHGNKVSAQGLRELFRHCAESLQELNFTGCCRGHLTGDHMLLHAAARCNNISKLDASWCNVNDNGIVAIAEASDRLESLCVNGCQQLSDEALNAVVVKHGIYLHTLELFGCFNLTSRGLVSIANHCKSLTTLNLGQCWKLTDTCISNLAPTLTAVENLDLRGCKQIKDQTVHQVVKNCPHLRTLSLANCVNVTDASLAEIATYCPEIQSLDLCGCKQVTNQGVRSLAHSCQVITFLDLSSTAITSKSVTTLASYSCRHLEVLKVNFCKQISTQCLIRLTKNSKKLQKLYLYGVRGLGSLEDVKKENEALLIETDQNKPV